MRLKDQTGIKVPLHHILHRNYKLDTDSFSMLMDTLLLLNSSFPKNWGLGHHPL
jgi:hypothetical protein